MTAPDSLDSPDSPDSPEYSDIYAQGKARDLQALVGRLSDQDFALLAQCVQARLHTDTAKSRQDMRSPRSLPPFAVDTPHADSAALERLDAAFAARLSQARTAQQRLSRLRVWLVFSLLRHAGLRLGEALAFDDRRDLLKNELRVGGPHERHVPLSPQALQRLRDIVDAPEAQTLRGQLARLDEGYLRRSLYARAKECALEPSLASARALRTARAIELCRSGMPLKIVQAFLGQASNDPTAALLHYAQEDANTIINYYLHKDMKMKTSARNVFPGRVLALRHSGILVEVTLRTFTGLDVVSVITEESCQTLGLEEGKTAIATVKAPWVILNVPLEEAGTGKSAGKDAGAAGEGADDVRLRLGATSARNCFAGTVVAVRRSEVATEVQVNLHEGSRVCALITTDSADSLGLFEKPERTEGAAETEGAAVLVSFKAFSVILGID